MKKKIITLCMVLVLALSAVVMTGCNLALNVGTIKWVEKPATVYSLNDQTGLNFTIEAEVDGKVTMISYPTTEYDVKVKNFTTNTVGTRTATVTYENLKLSFTYTVIDSKFAGGTGDEADPYKVSSPAQFQNMLNQTTFGYYELTNTIDFSGYALKMANNGANATNEEAWTGVIDGNGYSLIGISKVLTPDGQEINKYNEIFGKVAYKNEKFVLKNVTVAFASTGASATMGLVTSNATDGEIEFENVKLTGYLNAANSGNSNVSPFVTFLQRGGKDKNALKSLTLKNCSSDLKILNAYATSLVAGFVSGQTDVSTGAVKFVNCSFDGLIEGAFQYGSGAFYTNNANGANDDATFTNCTVGANAKIIKTSGMQATTDVENYNCGNVSVDKLTNHLNTLEGITGNITVDTSLKALDFVVDESLKVTATVEGAAKYEIYAVGTMSYNEKSSGAFRFVQPATAGEDGKLEYTLLKIKSNAEGSTTNTETTYGSNLIVNENGTLVYYCATVCKSINVKTAQVVVVAYNAEGKAIAISSTQNIDLMAE